MSEDLKKLARRYTQAVDDHAAALEESLDAVLTKCSSGALATVMTEQWPTLHGAAVELAAKRQEEALNAFVAAAVSKQPEPPVVDPPLPGRPPRPTPVGVSPLGFAYKTTENLPAYSRPGAVLIAGRTDLVRGDNPAMQSARALGAEILQYFVPSDVPDALNSAFDRDFYGSYKGRDQLWPLPRSKWPKTQMANMTPGSDWIRHCVDKITEWIVADKVDGAFLDTIGARTYAKGADWESWSNDEKEAYMLGNIDLVRRLDARRRELGRLDFILVCNSLFFIADKDFPGGEAASAVGEQYIDGCCMEHHDAGSKFHQNYVQRRFSGINRRVFAIANGQEQARLWARNAGITHVTGQEDANGGYGHPLPPPIPFNYVAPRA